MTTLRGRLHALEAASRAGGVVLVTFEDGSNKRLSIIDSLDITMRSYAGKCTPRVISAKVVAFSGNIARIPEILEHLTGGVA